MVLPLLQRSCRWTSWPGGGACSEETKCGRYCKFKFSVYHLKIGPAWLAATFYCKVLVGLITVTMTEHWSDRSTVLRLVAVYLRTYSMVQSPSWEANWFAPSQEIPRISQNPNVHYRTHKRSPPVSILGQPNPVHIPTSHLLEIHPNIGHPSTPRSPQWFLPSGFPTKTLYTPLLTHTRHMPSPS